MNERLMRSAPNGFAQFVTAFEEAESGKAGPLWLVWRYEGDFTLADLMKVRSGIKLLEEDTIRRVVLRSSTRYGMLGPRDHHESVSAQMAMVRAWQSTGLRVWDEHVGKSEDSVKLEVRCNPGRSVSRAGNLSLLGIQLGASASAGCSPMRVQMWMTHLLLIPGRSTI